MPHYSLVVRPFHIWNEDDAGLAYEQWKKEPSPFKPPAILKTRKITHPLVLEASTRIMFVSGRVIGAAELLNLDVFGKSDPYCVIEAVPKSETSADAYFVHRTQICYDTLTPEWEEHFHFNVPEGVDLYCIRFSVWDFDKLLPWGSQVVQDEALGSATVDVSYLKNGEVLKGELPLIGARKNQAKSIFQRQSRIVFELTVERRVMPVLLNHAEADVVDAGRHVLSREPPSKVSYYNVSQEPVFASQSKLKREVSDDDELRRRPKPKVVRNSTLDRLLEDQLLEDEVRPKWMPPYLRLGKEIPGPEPVPDVAADVLALSIESEINDRDANAKGQVEKELPSRLFDFDRGSLGTPMRGLEDRRGPPLSFIDEQIRIRAQALARETPSSVYACVGKTALAARTFTPGGLMDQRRGLQYRDAIVTPYDFSPNAMHVSELNAYKQFLLRPTPLLLNCRDRTQEYAPKRAENATLPYIAVPPNMVGSRSLSFSVSNSQDVCGGCFNDSVRDVSTTEAR